MRKIGKNCCIALFISFLFLSACGGPNENDSSRKTSLPATPTIRQTETLPTGHHNIGPYWTGYEEDGIQYIIVKDKNGKEFFHDAATNGWFEQIDDSIILRKHPGGNEMYSIQYFDVERGLVSPIYWKPCSTGFGKVAHGDLMNSDGQKIVVHDMFDSETNRITFERKGLHWGGQMWAPEADYTVFPFIKAEFLDENHLHVVYLSVERTADGEIKKEFVEEILQLN